MELLKPGLRIYYFKNIHLSAEAGMFLDSHHPVHPGFSSGFSILLRVTVFCRNLSQEVGSQPEFFTGATTRQPLGLGVLPTLNSGVAAPREWQRGLPFSAPLSLLHVFKTKILTDYL